MDGDHCTAAAQLKYFKLDVADATTVIGKTRMDRVGCVNQFLTTSLQLSERFIRINHVGDMYLTRE